MVITASYFKSCFNSLMCCEIYVVFGAIVIDNNAVFKPGTQLVSKLYRPKQPVYEKWRL